jgi:hypothetical protein
MGARLNFVHFEWGRIFFRTCAARWFFTTRTGLPAYPVVTSLHVAHADPAGPLENPTTVVPGFPLRPLPKFERLGCRCFLFRGSFLWFIRFAT